MPDTVLLLGLTGAIISALLSVIAYFLKFLVQDFRKLQQDFLEIKGRQESLRAEIDRISVVLLFLKKQLIRKV
ncbi:hypothetical protein J0A67_17380 [Algoriphagus aestuariicola]|jgi:hypothetical protein|uniref:Uncharacterized protein n=1 Tax=Algoriphagus aestuariicola TaxID=1852016 RepID=A0ABS3BTR1_9BACT|nr:hypothetical protein [Algoriphagus aestuariicola]MBN7802652.1 hypothetical protein [Algoriphagus aestuariicola]